MKRAAATLPPYAARAARDAGLWRALGVQPVPPAKDNDARARRRRAAARNHKGNGGGATDAPAPTFDDPRPAAVDLHTSQAPHSLLAAETAAAYAAASYGRITPTFAPPPPPPSTQPHHLRALAADARALLASAHAGLAEARREAAAHAEWRGCDVDDPQGPSPSDRVAGMLLLPPPPNPSVAAAALAILLNSISALCPGVGVQLLPPGGDDGSGVPLHARGEAVRSLAWSVHRHACAAAFDAHAAGQHAAGTLGPPQTPPLGLARGGGAVDDDAAFDAPPHPPRVAEDDGAPELVLRPYGVCVHAADAEPPRVHCCYEWVRVRNAWHVSAAWVTSNGSAAAARVYGPGSPEDLLRQLRNDTARVAATHTVRQASSMAPTPCILRTAWSDSPEHGDDAPVWHALLTADREPAAVVGSVAFPNALPRRATGLARVVDTTLDADADANGASACVALGDAVLVDVQLWGAPEAAGSPRLPGPTTPAGDGDEPPAPPAASEASAGASALRSLAVRAAGELHVLLHLDLAHAPPPLSGSSPPFPLAYHALACRLAGSLVAHASSVRRLWRSPAAP